MLTHSKNIFYFERQFFLQVKAIGCRSHLSVFLAFSFEFVFCEMDTSSDKCCVYVAVNSDCFKLYITKNLDLLVLLDLPPDAQRVIKLRVNS